MDAKTFSLDYWRSYFRAENIDVFEVIDAAILVAAYDMPNEFKKRRDQIAERLFSFRSTTCSTSDNAELVVKGADIGGSKRVLCGSADDSVGPVCKGSNNNCSTNGNYDMNVKESKANSSSSNKMSLDMNGESHYSYDEAVALVDAIEEENQMVIEVLKIKKIVDNSKDQSEELLHASLMKLKSMRLDMDTLKATEIGKAVSNIEKSVSKRNRDLIQNLKNDWRKTVDLWVDAQRVMAEDSPDSVNPHFNEEEGLPIPPMDEGAFYPAQSTSIELSQFFDGIDDEGNPQNNEEFRKGQPMKRQETLSKQNKPSNTNSSLMRPLKLSMEQQINNDMKLQEKQGPVGIQKLPVAHQREKLNFDDPVSLKIRLEACKRKLNDGYQKAKEAKMQRTIKVMELKDIPKPPEIGKKKPHLRTLLATAKKISLKKIRERKNGR